MKSRGDSTSRGPGGYELLAPLAQGGMGEVFLARKTGEGAFEKRVALKLLLPHLSEQPEFVQRFLDEARLAARMNHPNIVQIFDLGVADGRYFIAMALIDGTSLANLLAGCARANTVLPLPVVRLIATGLCEGLAYAHALRGPRGENLGVVHRDVNPSNILISTSGSVLLTDFGIAKAAGNSHQTQAGELRGKLAYMAPEQFLELPLDHRADIFAAGVTLLHTLTLTNPFGRSTDAATLAAVQKLELPPLRTLRPDLTPSMEESLRRALQRRPEDRYGSARELLRAFRDGPVAEPKTLADWLERMCGGQLAEARAAPSGPVTVTEAKSLLQPRSASRRWRLVGAVAAGTFFLLLASLGVQNLIASTPKVAPRGADEERLPATSPPSTAEPKTPHSEASASSTAETSPPPTQLEPAVPTATVPPRAAPREPRAAKPRAKAAPSATALRLGYITADSTPWSDLLLDGRRIERTPVSRYPVPVGEHTLVFRDPRTGKEVVRRVSVREGADERIRIRFPP